MAGASHQGCLFHAGVEQAFTSVLHQASQVRIQNQQWVHCLKVAGLLLQQLLSGRLHTTGAGQFCCVEDLWPFLILPGLGHAVAAVRHVLIQQDWSMSMQCMQSTISGLSPAVAAVVYIIIQQDRLCQ